MSCGSRSSVWPTAHRRRSPDHGSSPSPSPLSMDARRSTPLAPGGGGAQVELRRGGLQPGRDRAARRQDGQGQVPRLDRLHGAPRAASPPAPPALSLTRSSARRAARRLPHPSPPASPAPSPSRAFSRGPPATATLDLVRDARRVDVAERSATRPVLDAPSSSHTHTRTHTHTHTHTRTYTQMRARAAALSPDPRPLLRIVHPMIADCRVAAR